MKLAIFILGAFCAVAFIVGGFLKFFFYTMSMYEKCHMWQIILLPKYVLVIRTIHMYLLRNVILGTTHDMIYHWR